MAADIILYEPTKVPVGDDQRQHLELTTNLIKRVNHFSGLNITIPKVIKSDFQRVMSLTNPSSKMSKSEKASRSRINIDDTSDVIKDKIRKAKTDSIENISYESGRPGTQFLFDL